MRHVIRTWLPLGVVLSAATVLGGCWHGDLTPPDKYTTRGKVVWHGEPVRFAIVNFQPTEPGKGAEAQGQTGADGTFETQTAPGQYEIVLESWDPARCGPLPSGAAPTRIKDELQTGVVVQTKAEDNDLDIQVPDQPAPASAQAPGGR